jgi:hypothetical protein
LTTRLLAHAGFDARHAIEFWKDRRNAPEAAACSPTSSENREAAVDTRMRRITGEYHPDNAYRVRRLEEELARWDAEKRIALRRQSSTT